MLQAELPFFFLLSILLLAAPFLPSNILMTLDNIGVRILVVIALLYLISIGPTAGIFGLVAFGILFMERNRRKVKYALKKWDKLDSQASKFATVEQASTPQQNVPVAPFLVPEQQEKEFLPDDTMDISVFEPVAPTMNEKVVFSSAYPLSHRAGITTSAMESVYEQLGVGHVRGVETVGSNDH